MKNTKLSEVAGEMISQLRHTATPWKIMADPIRAGDIPFAGQRFIATADAVVEDGAVNESWRLVSGSLICTMRNGPKDNGAFIVRAVNSHVALVDALEGLLAVADLGEIRDEATKDAIAAAVVALALANGEGSK